MMQLFHAAAYASHVSARRSKENVCLHKPVKANTAADLDRILWGGDFQSMTVRLLRISESDIM